MMKKWLGMGLCAFLLWCIIGGNVDDLTDTLLDQVDPEDLK